MRFKGGWHLTMQSSGIRRLLTVTGALVLGVLIWVVWKMTRPEFADTYYVVVHPRWVPSVIAVLSAAIASLWIWQGFRRDQRPLP